MATVIRDPADVVNLALARIGYKDRIGNIYEGSAPAKAALDVYSQTRDEILRIEDWGFAGRDMVMTLLKQAPVEGYFPTPWDPALHPPIGFLFEYAYPDDCLKVRAIKPSAIFALNYDPQPRPFRITNDAAYAPPRRVILSNVENAVLVYTGQVTDPKTWEPNFVEAFSAALGRRLAPLLSGPDMTRLAVQDEAVQTQIASMTQG